MLMSVHCSVPVAQLYPSLKKAFEDFIMVGLQRIYCPSRDCNLINGNGSSEGMEQLVLSVLVCSHPSVNDIINNFCPLVQIHERFLDYQV